MCVGGLADSKRDAIRRLHRDCDKRIPRRKSSCSTFTTIAPPNCSSRYWTFRRAKRAVSPTSSSRRSHSLRAEADSTLARANADPPLVLSTSDVALFTHLCDLLCFFITHHTFRSKYFVLSSLIGTHVSKLFHTKHKHLRLAALRFFRAILGKNDDFYNRYLVKNDMFRAVLEVCWDERGRDNLLGSAGLEFFETVRLVSRALLSLASLLLLRLGLVTSALTTPPTHPLSKTPRMSSTTS